MYRSDYPAWAGSHDGGGRQWPIIPSLQSVQIHLLIYIIIFLRIDFIHARRTKDKTLSCCNYHIIITFTYLITLLFS